MVFGSASGASGTSVNETVAPCMEPMRHRSAAGMRMRGRAGIASGGGFLGLAERDELAVELEVGLGAADGDDLRAAGGFADALHLDFAVGHLEHRQGIADGADE